MHVLGFLFCFVGAPIARFDPGCVGRLLHVFDLVGCLAGVPEL